MFALRRFLTLSCLLACGLALPNAAIATQIQKYSYQNPGAACQLSIPTTDTQVRPKATGFRNESTTKSAFVICGYNDPSNESYVTSLDIYFTSIDGADRAINCTAVTGIAGINAPVYSTKAVSSTAAGAYAVLEWLPTDFFGTTEIPNGFAPSITCTLPPQTAISIVYDGYKLEIGS